jgi:predicted DNA binding CopG/RHH family protein|tara:strand:- start:24358 stop:24489 length:132 start_codon:yes stop_codon:yes gene_type:complete
MREQVIKVRLSDREAEELRRAADALGMPPATWLRMIANKELSK